MALGACVGDEPGAQPGDDGGSTSDAASDATNDGAAPTDGSGPTDAGSDAARPVPPHVGDFGWKAIYADYGAATQVAYDNAGNLYAAVNYGGNFSADATHAFTYVGSYDDIAIISLDPAGHVRWTTSYATASDEEVDAIETDGTDVYITGDFNGSSLDFGNGKSVTRVTTAAEYEPFVVKLRGADGQAQWAWNYASPSATANYTSCRQLAFGAGHLALSCVSDRSIALPLTTGATQTVAPENATGSPLHSNNFMLASLDPATGKALWATDVGADYQTTADAIAVARDGSIAVASFTFGTSVQDTTGTLSFTNPRGSDRPAMFAFKVGGADGHTAWTAKFTDNAQSSTSETADSPHGIAFDSKGNVIVSGQIYGTVPIAGKNVTAHDTNKCDAFVALLDGSNGSAQWAIPYGGTNLESPAAIAVDPWDEIFVAGEYQSSDFVAGGTTLPASAAQATYVLKLDPVGNVYWAYGTVELPDASSASLGVAGSTRVIADPSTGGVTVVTGAGNGSIVDFGDGEPVASSVTSTFLVHRAP